MSTSCRTCGAALAAADLERPNCRFCGAVHPHVATARAQVEGLRQVMGLPYVPGIGPAPLTNAPPPGPIPPMVFGPPALLAPPARRGPPIVALLAGGIAVGGAALGIFVAVGASTSLFSDDSAARACTETATRCDAQERAAGGPAGFLGTPEYERCFRVRMGVKIASGTTPQRAMAKKLCTER